MMYSMTEIISTLAEIESELAGDASACELCRELSKRLPGVSDREAQDGLFSLTADLREQAEDSFLSLPDIEADVVRTLGVLESERPWEALRRLAATGNPRAIAWWQRTHPSEAAAIERAGAQA